MQTDLASTVDECARAAYRATFRQLRGQVDLHPRDTDRPSDLFRVAAETVRTIGSECLPLGMAVTMHLYPLCALQSVPMPMLSPARFKRALLLRRIHKDSLILANAGSERVRGADIPLTAAIDSEGLSIDGTCEYMSLASVADVVLLKATLADGRIALCAASLHGDSVRIGTWKFGGRMRLADTSSVTFVRHRIPDGRFVVIPNGSGLQCVADYQRCWFHLLLSELYLARLDQLHDTWRVTRTAGHAIGLHEVARLRDDSLRLLDGLQSTSQVEPLIRVTSLMKLRVSMMAQVTALALRRRGATTPANAAEIEEDASELGYMRLQPTADEKILRSLKDVEVPRTPSLVTS
jgi:hypothetical protein